MIAIHDQSWIQKKPVTFELLLSLRRQGTSDYTTILQSGSLFETQISTIIINDWIRKLNESSISVDVHANSIIISFELCL